MEVNCTQVSYSATDYFSKIIIDYLEGNEKLRPFYKHAATFEGIASAVNERKLFPQQRKTLVDELVNQYKGIDISPKLQENIASLLQQNTFTVTTAHQPNIFTGPVFFIYKILHTIKLAGELNKQFPQNYFVPVYYMGSEDADIEELGNITVDGIKYEWQTTQTGSVGRMEVDTAFTGLLNAMEGQVSVLDYGCELVEIFRDVYTEGKTIQQATLELVNKLFGEYGLVTLIPDNRKLKKIFAPVIEKELKEKFSHKAVETTVNELEKNYKAQAAGRELNLFYLIDDRRERIEVSGIRYQVPALGLGFSLDEIVSELEKYPERFSPNVILRGVLQETVLPNIAFIGGGGEIAYWLELKKVFEAAGVPYPALVLRNSFLIVEEKWKQKMDELSLAAQHIFFTEHELMNHIVETKNEKPVGLDGLFEKTELLYAEIMQLAAEADATLRSNAEAIKTRAVKDLQELEKKMIRAAKRKFELEQKQIQKIKEALFPGGDLQEREENITWFYAKYGKEIILQLLNNSPSMEQVFSVISITQ